MRLWPFQEKEERGLHTVVRKETMDMRRFNLSEGAKLPYSKTERLLFALLPQDGSKISTKILTERRRSKAEDWRIDNPRNAVHVTMTSLRTKIKENKEKFRLKKTPQRGPYSIEFWLERPKRRTVSR